MMRHELSKYDFECIDHALDLTIDSLRKSRNFISATAAEELRKQFKDAHTGWLWFEDQEKKQE
jgi:hypothetical protein